MTHEGPQPARHAAQPAAEPVPHIAASASGPISFDGAPLRLPGALPSDPFVLAGRRAVALGTEGGGVHTLWVHPMRVLHAFAIRDISAADAEVTALGVIRRFTSAGVPVEEHALVPHELGALLLEWRAPGAAALELSWQMDLRVAWPSPDGAPGDLQWHRDERTLRVRASDDAGAIVCCRFDAAPERWLVTTDASHARLHVSVRLALAAGEPLRFLVAATHAGEQELAAMLSALRDPVSLVRGRAAALRRQHAERLDMDTPEPDLATAVAWAKLRLDNALVATPGVGRSLVAGYGVTSAARTAAAVYHTREAAWSALGCLASGDFAAPRDVLRFLGERQDAHGLVPAACSTSGSTAPADATATALYLLLAARHHAWSGETAFLAGEWARIRAALAAVLAADPAALASDDAAIRAAAITGLERVAQDLGERALSLELHTRARRERAALGERLGRRHAHRAGTGWSDVAAALPLLPALLAPADCASWLDSGADRVLGDATGAEAGPLGQGLLAWAEYGVGRAAAGWEHLRSLPAPLRTDAKGAWSHPGPAGGGAGWIDHAQTAATLLSALVAGMLGAEPDAPRGRVRLRPQLPAPWDRFELRNLRIGEAALSMEFEREAGRARFRVEQEQGSSPLTLVLEPVLSGQPVEVLVDGRSAQLDVRPFGAGVLVPVQLVLDAPRVLEIALVRNGSDA